MRLWHKDLITVLPSMQLKGQWRECCLIAKAIGCTDIRTESREATPDEIPKDKPWCSWFYAVSGKLPDMEETNDE